MNFFLLAIVPFVALQGEFTDLGDGRAHAVSSDGTVVVGYDLIGPYSWTKAGGKVVLGQDSANDVSTDGKTVVGDMTIGSMGVAGLWSTGSGWTGLGGLQGSSGCGSDLSSGNALSDDGQVATGLAWDGCTGRAYRWTPMTGMTALVTGPGSSRGDAVSGDGSLIGGWDSASSGSRRAMLWAPSGVGFHPLVGQPGNQQGLGEVWGLSTDGSFAVGSGLKEPFLYQKSSGSVMNLGTLPGLAAFDVCVATGVSDDGKTVVGFQGSFFGTPFQAWIWTPTGGIQTLATYLVNQGVVLPPSTTLQGAMDISPDGQTIVGWSGKTFSDKGFIVSLSPWDDLGGGTMGTSGVPSLTGSGPLSAFSLCGLALRAAVPQTVGLLAIATQSTPVPFVGGILHAFPIVSTVPVVIDSVGQWSLPFFWPDYVPVGSVFTFQVGVLDAAGVSMIVLSNGVAGTTP